MVNWGRGGAAISPSGELPTQHDGRGGAALPDHPKNGIVNMCFLFFLFSFLLNPTLGRFSL